MEELTTVKTCKMSDDVYSIVEYETDAHKQYNAAVAAAWDSITPVSEVESDGRLVQFYESAPRNRTIEPIRTWALGLIEGDVIEIMDFLGDWVEGHTSSLKELEIDELRVAIRERFNQ